MSAANEVERLRGEVAALTRELDATRKALIELAAQKVVQVPVPMPVPQQPNAQPFNPLNPFGPFWTGTICTDAKPHIPNCASGCQGPHMMLIDGVWK